MSFDRYLKLEYPESIVSVWYLLTYYNNANSHGFSPTSRKPVFLWDGIFPQFYSNFLITSRGKFKNRPLFVAVLELCFITYRSGLRISDEFEYIANNWIISAAYSRLSYTIVYRSEVLLRFFDQFCIIRLEVNCLFNAKRTCPSDSSRATICCRVPVPDS